MQHFKNLVNVSKVNRIFHKKSYFLQRKSKHLSSILCRSKHTFEGFKEIENNEERENYKEITNKYLGVIAGGHRVLVLQPYIKWGTSKRRNTTPELQLSEAVALVETLPYWYVSDKMISPLLSFKKSTFLGSGSLDNLKERVNNNRDISAVFISVNLLKYVQIARIQEALELPVYDRFSIIIHIFRQHAWTTEARLQVALAEIPYIRKKIIGIKEQGNEAIHSVENVKKVLQHRETKLKRALKKMETHRQLIRHQRKNYGIPSVAVVGYTNAGKTSLIKALTGDTALKPRNQLFATLDTTAHEGLLPCKLKILYMDTIGFIQDVPEMLLEPFKVTLEDAIISDVIVHVYDISHPDMQAQVEHVHKTLAGIVPANRPIIHVANKIDLLKSDLMPDNVIGVSSVNSIGIDDLQLKIQECILDTTRRSTIRVRVRSGSIEASWLYKETTVINAEPDPSNWQYLYLDVITTQSTLIKFKHFLRQ